MDDTIDTDSRRRTADMVVEDGHSIVTMTTLATITVICAIL